MCLIAYVPKGKSLSRDVIDNANTVNPHGIGVMSERGIEKFFGSKQLKRARNYINALAAEGVAHAVHWRYATHGSKGLALTHPFKLPNAEAYLMHNGVISATSKDAKEDASDTLLYVNKLVEAPLTYKSGDDLTYWDKVCAEIGSHNKAVVMYPDGEFIILHQDQGVKIDDIWYSNSYSLPAAMRPNASYFVPARLRPASTWTGEGGSYYDSQTGRSYYGSGLPSYPGRIGATGYIDRTHWNDPKVSPFGDIIRWNTQFNAYGFWVGSRFQKLVVYEGAAIHEHAMTADQKTTPIQTKLIDTTEEENDPRKCPRCMRFKKDPPMGYMVCWCTPEALVRYYANLAGGATEKPAMPSGPSLEVGEHPEEKPAVKASETLCEHGSDNWENCRECIAELEADTSSGFRQWLEDRKGHNWRLQAPDNGGHDPDDVDNVIPLLPRHASER